MAPGHPPRPDWRDRTGYAALLGAEPAALAWEWLRRDPRYAAAAGDAPPAPAAGGARVQSADAAAAQWGLHAFANPALAAPAARPVWRRECLARVLVADAQAGGAAGDRLDLARFADLASVVRAPGGAEHWLLADGAAAVRLDLVSGTLLAGPACLSYRLAGLASLHAPLKTLRALLRLWQSGRLQATPPRRRNRRVILLLRAWDALQEGVTQRELAAALLSAEASAPRWRSAAPSLRSQAQRLVAGAQGMARGGYRALLQS